MSQASGISGAGQPTHPLRQTSFPADEDLYGYGSGQRSPSVDAMSRVSGPSGVSGTTGSVAPTEKKKRGRKSRASIAAAAAAAAAQQSQQQQSQSQERSGSPSLVGDASTANSRRGYSRSAKNGAGDTAEEEEDDAAANEVMAMEQAARTQDQKREEARLRAMLVEALDKDQYLRYENWRAARLPDSVIRRVI